MPSPKLDNAKIAVMPIKIERIVSQLRNFLLARLFTAKLNIFVLILTLVPQPAAAWMPAMQEALQKSSRAKTKKSKRLLLKKGLRLPVSNQSKELSFRQMPTHK